MAWAEYMNHEERVKYEVINLVKILEHDGMPRTQAIQKIIDDHKDLPGFSRRTIYRELPEDMKDKNRGKPKKPLGQPDMPLGILCSTNSESQTLKALRDTKGTKEQSAKPIDVEDLRGNEEEVTYDSNFVNSLIAENEQLKIENFRLKKDYQELETKYKKLLNKTESD